MKNNRQLRIREISQVDYRAVVELLQVVSIYTPAETEHQRIWNIFSGQAHVYGVVVEQEKVGVEQVIGFGSLCVDFKIRGGSIGHIEDIVVVPEFRRQGVGNMIMRALVDLARDKGCYKVSLECRQDKMPFYEQLGFAHTGCAMSMLLGESSSSTSLE